MKKKYSPLVLIILSVFLFVAGCGPKNSAQEQFTTDLVENETTMKFDRDHKDLGRLQDGERVTTSFRFTNTGNYPLLISEVKGNCGCTVADYPINPIDPKESGMITVTYDSKGSKGLRISKEVTVVANTRPTRTKLYITAQIY